MATTVSVRAGERGDLDFMVAAQLAIYELEKESSFDEAIDRRKVRSCACVWGGATR
jgi:hypothetical protein